MKTLKDKMQTEIFKSYDMIVTVEESAEQCAQIAEQEKIDFAIEVLDWYEKLMPNQKISVWSKDGQYKGLFNLDNEQLVEKFINIKSLQDEKTI